VNGQNGAAAGANDQNAGSSSRADRNGQLPQTASPLPLIALAGFASLGLGLFLRRRLAHGDLGK
jgi:LPXTG-motif cell wall-anchored protein